MKIEQIKKQEPIKMQLQLFADGADDNQDPNAKNDNPDDEDKVPGDDPKDDDKSDKKYTEEELQKIIKDRIAREKKAAEKAVKEAEKLAKMNEDQKKQYELEKLQNELDEYKKKDAFYTMSKEASKMLLEKDIVADDEILQFVVKDTAEDTQNAVNSFISLIDTKVKEGVTKALAGKSPKVIDNKASVVTKEQFDKMGYLERLELKQKNEELYNQLNK